MCQSILLFPLQAAYYFLIFIFSTIFIIKYKNLKNKIKMENTIFNQLLVNQREVFINSLNHDLRIPIIAQLRSLELINNKPELLTGDSGRDILKQTENSCKYVLELMSLLIDAYNTENHTHKLEFYNVNIVEIIISVIKQLKKKQKKRISI